MNTLLTRDQFREAVFARDNNVCVFCEKTAVDAHHILERRLWKDGGYYLNNGASVCSDHHLQCETTEISVEDVRIACNITKPIIPEHLYYDEIYDKWGNTILPNKQRTKGELFYDESVQKILKNILHLFTDYVKYPRTFHLPWSSGLNDDDRMLESLSRFIGHRVIVTEKMDGENTSLYSNYYHARSVDSKNHPSRNMAKAFHANFAHDIPKGWRICCENLYAKHSIWYTNLEHVLYGFSVWNDRNVCLSWDESVEWFYLLNIISVPVMYDGIFDQEKIRSLYDEKRDWGTKEGYVVRIADSFSYGEYKNCVGKYVRSKHINTVKHWMRGQEIIPNRFKFEWIGHEFTHCVFGE